MRTSGLELVSLVLAFSFVGDGSAQIPTNLTPSFGANPNAANAGVMKMWENGGPQRAGAVGPMIARPNPGNVYLPGVLPPTGWHGRHYRWRPYWDYGYYGGYYNTQIVGVPYYAAGYPYAAYDPYSSTIQLQNQQLQQQLDRAMAANRQLQQNADAVANRLNVPVRNKRDGDQAVRDKQKNLEAKAKGLAIAGNRMFTAGLYSKAADRYRDAIRADAEETSNHFLLAQAYFANKQYAEAVRALKDGLKQNPDWIEADFDLRSLYGNPEQLTTQLADIARVVKANPLDRDANFLLGFELFMSGQKDKARSILEQSARLETNDSHLKPFFVFFEKQANAN